MTSRVLPALGAQAEQKTETTRNETTILMEQNDRQINNLCNWGLGISDSIWGQ